MILTYVPLTVELAWPFNCCHNEPKSVAWKALVVCDVLESDIIALGEDSTHLCPSATAR